MIQNSLFLFSNLRFNEYIMSTYYVQDFTLGVGKIKRNKAFSDLRWAGGGRGTYNGSFQCDSSVLPLQGRSQTQMLLGARPILGMSGQACGGP